MSDEKGWAPDGMAVQVHCVEHVAQQASGWPAETGARDEWL